MLGGISRKLRTEFYYYGEEKIDRFLQGLWKDHADASG